MEENQQGQDVSQEINKLLEASPKKKKKGKLKWILIGVLVLVLLFIAKNVLFPAKPMGTMVSVQALTKGDIQEKISLSGPVSGTDAQQVTSGLHAKVTEILVKEGDKVEKGQVLARLDKTDVNTALEAAKTQLDLAKANKTEAEKNLRLEYEKNQTILKNAELDFQRKSSLYSTGDIPQSDYEAAESALKDAKATMANYKVVKGAVQVPDTYDLQIKTAEQELEKAESKVSDADLVSPIAGTITRVNIKVGEFADTPTENKYDFTVENLDQLELSIAVSEYNIGKVHLGQKATITADILGGESLEGVVSSISPTGEEKNANTSERVIPIKVQITGDKKGLLSGITAKADLLLSEAKDVYVVPISAVMTGEDGSNKMAFVVNGTVHFVPVTTGVTSDVSMEVKPVKEDSAFKEGSNYILSPDASLTEGSPVTVDPTAQGSESVSPEEAGVVVQTG